MTEALRTDPPTLQTGRKEGYPDERATIARAQRDPRAFAPLYAAYFDPVYRYCLRCLGNRDAAADAVQDTFTQALAALPRYREEAFRPWLFTIAHNVIVDSHRRHGRRPADVSLDAAWQRTSQAPSPEDEAIAAEARRSVRFYTAQLPDNQRQVIELRLADLKGHEVAGILACSLGSVKTTQHRALRRLRELMGEAGAGGGARDGTC